MQSITTAYKCSASGQGRITVKSWYGKKSVLWDPALDSEDNHRQAVLSVLAAINADRDLNFVIVGSAPAPEGADGWVFLIEQVPGFMPCWMSITVRFMPGTNSGPAYMKAFSWMFPKGVRVNYSPAVADGSDTQGNARYAAGIMLKMINEKSKESGLDGYRIAEYIQDYKEDRIFSLRYL